MNNTARIRIQALANFISSLAGPASFGASHQDRVERARESFPDGVCLIWRDADGSFAAEALDGSASYRRLPRSVFAFGTDFDAAPAY